MGTTPENRPGLGKTLRRITEELRSGTKFMPVDDIPTDTLQLESTRKLEYEFYRYLSESERVTLGRSSLLTALETAVNALDSSVKDLQVKESALYHGLARSNPEYRKFLRFQSFLESEYVTWKIILALLVHRAANVLPHHPNSSKAEANNEKAVVDTVMKQPEFMDVRVVLNVLEDTFAKCSPPDLLLPILKAHPLPQRLRSGERVGARKPNLKNLLPATSPTEEEVFEAVFKSIRAGNFECAESMARNGGIGVFNLNYRLREYLTKSVPGERNSRIRWKRTAWAVSQDTTIGPWCRAVWGILCGNYAAALPVASGWQDELWIYITCFLDFLVESVLQRMVSGVVTPDMGMSSILPAEYWTNGLSISEIFDKLRNSEFDANGGSSISVFIGSIQAAITNAVEPSLLIYEDFVFTMADNRLPVNGYQPTFDTIRQANLVRFVIYVLSLVRDAGIPVDPVFYGRACFLNAQVAVERDVQLLAFYISRVPEDRLQEAVGSFIANKSLTDVADFLNALLGFSRNGTVEAGERFLIDTFLTMEEPAAADSVEVFGYIFKTFATVPEMTAVLLASLNRLVRLFLLSASRDAQSAYTLVHGIKNDLNTLLNNLYVTDKVDEITESAKSETACWTLYFNVCRKLDEYNRTLPDGSIDDVDESENVQEGLLAEGFQIFGLDNWLVGANTTEEPDRCGQLRRLHDITYVELYCSLMGVLKDVDDEKILSNMADLTFAVAEKVSKEELLEAEEMLQYTRDVFEKTLRKEIPDHELRSRLRLCIQKIDAAVGR